MSVQAHEVYALQPPARLKMTIERATPLHLDGSRIDKIAGNLLVSLACVVGTYLAVLGLHYLLHLERLQALLLLPVIAAAMRFGVGYGALAAVVGVGFLGRFMPLTPEPLQLARTQTLPLLSLYLTAALAAGLFARTWRLRRAIISEATVADPSVAPRFASGAGRGPLQALEAKLAAGLVAASASLSLVATGGGALHLIGGAWVQQGLPLVLMATVLAAGGTYGAAAGVLAGVAAAVVPYLGAGSTPLAAVQALLLFAGAGGALGLMADRVRHDREALRRLRQAADALSQPRAEAEIWEEVAEAAADLAGGPVHLTDEAGRMLHSTGAQTPGRSGEPPSRARQLTVDGNCFGSLAWSARSKSRSDQRTIDQALGVLADIGASAAMRSKLGAEKSEMEFVARTEQLRTILLDAVSHHFRTPLSSIIGSVTNLLEHAEQHDVRASHEFLLIIKEQANRLDRYVENFLGVARLESGSIEFHPRAMDLEPLVNDVWESFGESGGARRFLDVQIEDRAILSDPGPLKQVLGNLLENAIKFSEEETIVSVTGRAIGSTMVLEVMDEGGGVSAADMPRIFGRFFRSRTAKASGLGLGLYITKSLVELMGGAIEAVNRSDGNPGLVMRVTLPLADS